MLRSQTKRYSGRVWFCTLLRATHRNTCVNVNTTICILCESSRSIESNVWYSKQITNNIYWRSVNQNKVNSSKRWWCWMIKTCFSWSRDVITYVSSTCTIRSAFAFGGFRLTTNVTVSLTKYSAFAIYRVVNWPVSSPLTVPYRFDYCSMLILCVIIFGRWDYCTWDLLMNTSNTFCLTESNLRFMIERRFIYVVVTRYSLFAARPKYGCCQSIIFSSTNK